MSCAYAAQARLRRTPAQTLRSLGAVLGRIEESSLVGRADAPASQLLNVIRNRH